MSLKIKYFAFIILLHGLITYLVYQTFIERKMYFLISEALLLVSLYLSYRIYKSFIYPIELMSSGKLAIQEEDFTIKYNTTGATEIDSLITVYNEMIDRLRLEKTRTEEQSYFLENIIQHSPIGMVIMDFDQQIDLINSKGMQLLGIKSLKKEKLSQLDHPLATALSKMKPYQDTLITLGGSRKFKCKMHQIIHKGFPRQFVLVEELTEELLTAEKEAYGKVIRMMAHEVNNSMGAVNSILESVHEYAFDHNDADQDLKTSLEIAIERNKALGKFTRNFAQIIRLPKPQLVTVDLNKLVQQSADLHRIKALKNDIEIDVDLHESPILIKGDAAQLAHVFGNMLKNAMESIESDGLIRIITCQNPSSFSIIDNGAGISEDAAANLFKPFFSTKTNGQGIGLMLIREILTAHQAKFDLYTDPKDGLTKFTVEF